MRLYHGTNTFFKDICLSFCNPYKDFGQGFYLTPNRAQAETMAYRRMRITKQGNPTILTFIFDEKQLDNGDLKVLTFEKPSKEWAEFILHNRYEKLVKRHDYDIVIGPIADDGVAFQLERYAQGIISLEQLVIELSYRRLDVQYFFGTEKSLTYLKQVYD